MTSPTLPDLGYRLTMSPMLKTAYGANTAKLLGKAPALPARTSIGGGQTTGQPATGVSASSPILSAPAPRPPKIGPPQSTPDVPADGAALPRTTMKVAMLPDVAGLPASQSLGALLGLLFGRVLDAAGSPAAAGASRDAAIGAAAYMSAESDLAARLKHVQDPGFFPTVIGGMPVVPQPAVRHPGQIL